MRNAGELANDIHSNPETQEQLKTDRTARSLTQLEIYSSIALYTRPRPLHNSNNLLPHYTMYPIFKPIQTHMHKPELQKHTSLMHKRTQTRTQKDKKREGIAGNSRTWQDHTVNPAPLQT